MDTAFRETNCSRCFDRTARDLSSLQRSFVIGVDMVQRALVIDIDMGTVRKMFSPTAFRALVAQVCGDHG